MVHKFLAAVVYGDTLMYLTNKTRPYEVVHGAADRLAQKWLARLSEAFKSGKAQALGTIKQLTKAIAHEFADLPITNKEKSRSVLSVKSTSNMPHWATTIWKLSCNVRTANICCPV